jgi:type IV secretion system protein TrbF
MFGTIKNLYQKYYPISQSGELVGSTNQVTDFSSAAVLETPYNLAKQEWDERMGSIVVRARNWRYMSFLLAITLALSFGLLYKQSDKPPVKPMIVEVATDTGQVKQVIDVSKVPFNPSDSLKKHFMWNWIKLVRGASRDLVLVNNHMVDMFHFVTEQGRNKLSDLIDNRHPFLRYGEGETVSLEFVSMNQITNKSYLFQWRETTFIEGKRTKEQMWSSTITIEISAPKDESVLMVNPLGLWIDDFSFSKLENFKE